MAALCLGLGTWYSQGMRWKKCSSAEHWLDRRMGWHEYGTKCRRVGEVGVRRSGLMWCCMTLRWGGAV
eukprot:305469-Chlamydomonas_euryale.AAC.2